MGLSQSLYTGWTGLTTHQRYLDNIGNNLSNVNTVGYKKNDYMFSNVMSQVMHGAYGADGDRGSVNGISLGLGTSTGAILGNFKQGPIETTNNPLDVAIDGKGFFLAGTSSGLALTRDGSFYLDHTVSPRERMLCVGDGLPVQGWNAVNGVVSPSSTVGNIYIPAFGDKMPGNQTTKVDVKGVLPTNTSSSDFNGTATSNLELKGNLPSDGNTLTTHIFASVTRTGGDNTVRNEVQEIPVEISFEGPTLSPDGTLNNWTWTMKTVDWPNPGDPSVQIYPPTGDDEFSQGTVKFHAESSPEKKRAAGQVAEGQIKPGSTNVKTETVDENGNTVTTSFVMPSGFTLDVSRLTSLDDPPGGDGLEMWYVNGNPKGSMGRTITVYDEYTDFEQTTDDAGNTVMEAVRRVDARQNTLYFTKTGSDDNGADWSWRSSVDDAEGTLRFNTIGDMVSSTGGGGSIEYDFGELTSVNSQGAIHVASQDGYPDGYLEDISIDQHGKIFGHYTNKLTEVLAQIAIGTVPNTSGLEGVAGTLFYPGVASGALQIGIAGDTTGQNGLAPIGAGTLKSNCLESSNVDLSIEFTNMINAQRGYQFNGKTITTADEMLQTALGLKR